MGTKSPAAIPSVLFPGLLKYSKKSSGILYSSEIQMVANVMVHTLLDEQTIGKSADIAAPLIDDIISEICRSIDDVNSIYIFGSFHQASTNLDSDIDIAVRAKKIISSSVLWDLATALTTICQREVDLVDLHSASTVMKIQIIHYGQKIFCASEIENDSYEDYVCSSYARLNEERAGILEDIRIRGSVYG